MFIEKKSDEISLLSEFREPSFAEKLGFLKQPDNFATKAIHTGSESEPGQINCSSVIPLINLTSTYKLAEAHNPKAYQYSRFGNPTRNNLESCLAALDNAKFAVTFSSGLGAQTAIISSLKKGDGILVDRDINLSTVKLLKKFAVNMEMEVNFTDFNGSLEDYLKPNLKLAWFETPSLPTMKIIDIKNVSEFIHQKSEAKIVVDNSSLSSYLQRPLDLGADIVIYSLTKYMHGHSDVIMGSLAINDEKIHEKLKYHQGASGIIPSPFDCFMVNRSLKTLSLRMDQHLKTAYILARWLQKHPKIEKVLHPALDSHPNHKISLLQSYGHSGVFSFILSQGNLEKTEKFLTSLKVFLLIESPGGFESFMRSPIFTTHKGLSEEELKRCGISEGMINVSIGLEDVQDLAKDINDALMKV